MVNSGPEGVAGARAYALGVSGWPFRSSSLSHALERVRSIGLGHLDFWPEIQGDLTDDDVRRIASDAGICLYSYNVPERPRLGSNAADEDVRAPLYFGLERAKALGVSHVQFYGESRPEGDLNDTIRDAARILKPVARLAEELGIELWFENDYCERAEKLGPAINRTAYAIKHLIDAVESPLLKVTFDACNFAIAGEEAYPDAFETLYPHIANVHVKDARRLTERLGVPDSGAVLTSDVKTGAFLPVPLGEGIVNQDSILRRCVQESYQGYITLDALCHDAAFKDFFVNDCEYVKSRVQFMR